VAAELARHFAVEGQVLQGGAAAAALEEEEAVVDVEGDEEEEHGDKQPKGQI
jgi:hypothetical protein